MTDDWKRRKDKNREMKNADKQGAERWSPQRDGVSGHFGHIRHQNINTDLTSQTLTSLAAVNSDKTKTFLMMRMSEEDQVQTTTSNTNATT